MEKPRKILFVCLGNICRSPMAEGLFLDKAEKAGLSHLFEVDSAGLLDYHVGSLPDVRMIQTARNHGIVLRTRARQVTAEDLFTYDHILAMDRTNERDLRALTAQKDFLARLELMRKYDPHSDVPDVPDPFHESMEHFEKVYAILDRSVTAFLKQITNKE